MEDFLGDSCIQCQFNNLKKKRWVLNPHLSVNWTFFWQVLVSRWSKPAARNSPRFEKSWNAFPQLKKPPAHHQVDLSDFPVKVKLHQPSQVKEFSHEKLVAIRNAPWDEVQNCDLRPSQGSHLDLTKLKLICRWGGDPSIQLEVCQQAQVAKLLTCPVHMLTPYLCMYL